MSTKILSQTKPLTPPKTPMPSSSVQLEVQNTGQDLSVQSKVRLQTLHITILKSQPPSSFLLPLSKSHPPPLRSNPLPTRPPKTPQTTPNLRQPPPLLLPLRNPRPTLPPKTRNLHRHKLHHSPRTHRRHLLRRAPRSRPGRRPRRIRRRPRTVLAQGNRAHHAPGRELGIGKKSAL